MFAKTCGILLTFVISSFVGVYAQEKGALKAIPYSLHKEEKLGTVSLKNNKVIITAHKGSDLYTNPDATKSTDNTPRLSFTPDSDFIFSAKVNTSFDSSFDGAALFIYADTKHWAKLLFERFASGKIGISTTVTNNSGDDAYHRYVGSDQMYLKIAKRGKAFIFYFSEDGKHWEFLRTFGLDTQKDISVGLTAQSPVGEDLQAEFSHIKLEEKTISDFWQGK